MASRNQPDSRPSRWRARLLAFYLPQFHPIPENDRWWGPGFTEWTNVARARPLFPGHYQPHIPADLGFYDLRLAETRRAQAELAAAHGIEGFCYWHYWFAGLRLLERPFQEVLESGAPDFPFCLGWANQSWSGIWHGAPHRILVEQTYPGADDARRHFEHLLPALRDPRYVRVDGRPILVIYRPQDLPPDLRLCARWREHAEREGLGGLYLVGVHDDPGWSPRAHGFDARTGNRPDAVHAAGLHRFLGARLLALLKRLRLALPFPRLVRYSRVTRGLFAGRPWPADHHPCAVPSWDNTPRAGARGTVYLGTSPTAYAAHLGEAIAAVETRPPEQRLVFVKSWNEWAEGNHLEPDLRHGLCFLERQREVLRA